MQQIGARLEDRIRKYQDEAFERGSIPFKTPIEIRIVGQMALLLSGLNIPMTSTIDLDAIYPNDFTITKMLEDELLKEGLILEPNQNLIWMPKETTYRKFYEGPWLQLLVAEPLFVISSKCKFKRTKDRNLLSRYFEMFPSAREEIEAMGIATEWVRS